MMPDTQDSSSCKPAGRKKLRPADVADLPELTRLFCSMQADLGSLHDVSMPKMTAAFEAGIARRELMLVVAPGTRGRLNGFLLIGLVEPWFSARPRLAELAFCVDSGHLRSRSVRELRKFAAWARRQTDATGANSLSSNQNYTPTTLPPTPTANPETASDEKAVQDDLDGAIDLLQVLARRNAPPLSGTNEGAPMPPPGLAQPHPTQKNGGG
jgi:hypothetical protein